MPNKPSDNPGDRESPESSKIQHPKPLRSGLTKLALTGLLASVAPAAAAEASTQNEAAPETREANTDRIRNALLKGILNRDAELKREIASVQKRLNEVSQAVLESAPASSSPEQEEFRTLLSRRKDLEREQELIDRELDYIDAAADTPDELQQYLKKLVEAQQHFEDAIRNPDLKDVPGFFKDYPEPFRFMLSVMIPTAAVDVKKEIAAIKTLLADRETF